jgi:hypothetical protein
MISKYLKDIIAANTSLVNFCEHDNKDGYIYEYYNTLSSLSFTLFGIYGIITNKKNNYICRVKYTLYMMLIFVGILSAYYHAALSEFSHTMDIVSISMILSTSMYSLRKILVTDKSEFEEYINSFRYGIEMMLYTFLAFTMPILHIMAEFYNGYVLKNVLEKAIDDIKCKNLLPENKFLILCKKYTRCRMLFVLSFIFWIIDYFLCEFLNGYHFHFIFHILIAYVAYELIDLLNYFYVEKDDTKKIY